MQKHYIAGRLHCWQNKHESDQQSVRTKNASKNISFKFTYFKVLTNIML